MAKSPVYRYHEYTPFFLTSGDLLRLMWLEDRDTIWRRAGRLMRMHADRVTRMVEDAILGRRKDLHQTTERYDRSLPIDCNTASQAVNTTALATRRAHPDTASWATRWLQWDLQSPNERLSTYYYHRLVKELKDKNVKVTLFQVPEYFEPELAPEFVQQVEAIIGAPLLHMSRSQRAQLYEDRMFHDPTHLTPKGNVFFHAWLAAALQGVSKANQPGG